MGSVKLPANLFGFNLQRNSDGSTDGELNLVPQTIPIMVVIYHTAMVSRDKI